MNSSSTMGWASAVPQFGETAHTRPAGSRVLFSRDQEADHGRYRLIRGADHLGRRETLLEASLVGFEDIGSQGGCKVLRFESDEVEVGSAADSWLDIEWAISMTSFFIQDPLVLRRRYASARADADVDPAFVPPAANRRAKQ